MSQMSTATQPSEETSPQKQLYLDEVVQKCVTAWVLVTASVAGIVQSNPGFRRSLTYDPIADQNSIFISKLFAVSSFVFFLSNRMSDSQEKKSITNALMWTTMLPAITMGLIVPGRWTMSFSDMNGRPIDFAHYWEAIVCTTMLCNIMGEYTKCRALGKIATFWNAPVFILGFLSIITKEPFSSFYAWLAFMSFSIELVNFERMHATAMSGNTPTNMSKTAMWIAKWIAYIANIVVTFMWFLNRFEVCTYSDFIFFDHFFQWTAKAVFGLFVVLGLKG